METAATLRAALRALVHRLDDAATHHRGVVRHFRVGGGCVAIHHSGHADVAQLLTAIAPLAVPAPAGAADLDLYLWDARHDAVALPDSPLLRREHTAADALGGYSDAGLHAFFQPEAGVLSVFDAAARRAHWWLRDAAAAPYFERAAPFKHVLQWWVGSRGGALLHSAAIASADRADSRGLLISGPSGSGKSTTALACVDAGMGFASDDYVIVGGDDPPRVYLAYATAKVVRASLARFAAHAPHFRNLAKVDEKPMLFMHECVPAAVRVAFTPVAMVLPQVAHRTRTRFVPISGAMMLRALAPSSLMLFPLAGERSFARMAALCQRLPCLRAELADDPGEVADACATLLQSLPAAAGVAA